MRRIFLLFLILFVLAGCNGIQVNSEKLKSQCRLISMTTKIAVGAGLEQIAKKEGKEKVKKRAKEIKAAVSGLIMPMIAGEKIEEVTRKTVNEALNLLDKKLEEREKVFIQIGINLVLSFITLPDNPAAKISEGTRKRIVAFFEGIVEGIKAFLDDKSKDFKSSAKPSKKVKILNWKTK